MASIGRGSSIRGTLPERPGSGRLQKREERRRGDTVGCRGRQPGSAAPLFGESMLHLISARDRFVQRNRIRDSKLQGVAPIDLHPPRHDLIYPLLAVLGVRAFLRAILDPRKPVWRPSGRQVREILGRRRPPSPANERPSPGRPNFPVCLETCRPPSAASPGWHVLFSFSPRQTASAEMLDRTHRRR